ncbi:MAG: BON domain-containing protein [Burkholderiaceae bacterium]|jgi:osmotically-inducible protein OsmY
MKTDLELKNDVVEELRWEPSVTSENISVVAHNGVVTLSGTVPYYAEKWSAERAARRVHGVKAIAEELDVRRFEYHNHKDAEIATAVVSSLKWHVWVPDAVQATVEKGHVTLTGSVKWEFERNSAEDAVQFLAGVTGVSNKIAIQPGVEPKAVSAAIEKALKRDAGIDAANIKVSSSGGKVTLSGSIPSWQERQGAAWAAWSAPGVTEVQNDLAVID